MITCANNLKFDFHCLNCGKIGHLKKYCNDPITSIGIIAFKIDYNNIINELKKDSAKVCKLNKTLDSSVNIISSNRLNMNNIRYINIFKKSIKFLLIRRKHSYGYIELIMGKYKIYNTKYIKIILASMTNEEIDKVLNNDFDFLYCDIYGINNYHKIADINKSRQKFNYLKESGKLREMINSVTVVYFEPEWGFPKGRRNINETNIECATREFYEETGISSEEINVYDNIIPIHEIYYGTDGLKYKHTYYIAETEENETMELKIKENNYEIGDIKWVSLDDALQLLRCYQHERKKILSEVYLFIINKMINCF